jgi:hypothetical protein
MWIEDAGLTFPTGGEAEHLEDLTPERMKERMAAFTGQPCE